MFSYRFICPIEGVGMFIWSVVEDIVNNSDQYYPNHPWWEFTETSFLMTFTQVNQALLLKIINLGLNKNHLLLMALLSDPVEVDIFIKTNKGFL